MDHPLKYTPTGESIAKAVRPDVSLGALLIATNPHHSTLRVKLDRTTRCLGACQRQLGLSVEFQSRASFSLSAVPRHSVCREYNSCFIPLRTPHQDIHLVWRAKQHPELRAGQGRRSAWVHDLTHAD